MIYDKLGASSDAAVNIIRPPQHESCKYSNLSKKYLERNVDFKNQYCKLYLIRLEKMLPFIEERVKVKWNNKYPIVKLHKLQEQLNRECVVIGTLFKEQKLKPSLLKKLSEVNSLVPQPVYTHFTDDSDILFIEDDLQRYQLVGNIDVHKMITGVTCALLGTDQGLGKFNVKQICYADCREQIERPIKLTNDRFICFVSGLGLANNVNVGALKLFVDWISGFLDTSGTEASKISRLIIAGNSIRSEEEVRNQTSLVAKVVESNETLNAVRQFDVVLSQFVRFCPVDLMPGEFDPSNHLLAQQPMHNCLFSNAGTFKNLHCVTNPYEFEAEGLRILGTSGQPVTQIMSYSRIESPIEALEACLQWNHIAPTCPDTLGSYPYYDKDPFVIDTCPNVFFTGNQSEFSTKLYKGPDGQQIRLISVPIFNRTFSVVLVNLKNLECFDVTFDVDDNLLD